MARRTGVHMHAELDFYHDKDEKKKFASLPPRRHPVGEANPTVESFKRGDGRRHLGKGCPILR
jgi:hypothetical protein